MIFYRCRWCGETFSRADIIDAAYSILKRAKMTMHHCGEVRTGVADLIGCRKVLDENEKDTG